MYLVPPMEDEPPDEFVTFVAVHLRDAQRQAARLTGGPEHADEVYPGAFADVARHWRRLRLRRRITHRDAAGTYLVQRLTARAKHWRDEQIYEIEVRPYEIEVRPVREPVRAVHPASIALRKAPLLPDTVRIQARPVAEASIAWSHACTQAQWNRVARVGAVVCLVLLVLYQLTRHLPA